MFYRHLEAHLKEIASRYRCVSLLGPRQAGKTTLARKFFEGFEYCTLEDPNQRALAESDPRAFLARLKGNTILDEIQRLPDLLSYLQGILDDPEDERRWVLTGSDSLLLSAKISQSLAGRTRLLTVLPLAFEEIPEDLRPRTLESALFTGAYPRIFDECLDPSIWLGDYFQTYVQKDLRQLLNVSNLSQFEAFVKVLASRAGQLINYSSFENDVGVSHPTANAWMSVLETSYISFRLPPHFKNFSKRLIKTPKVYFWDTGLLCHLLQVRTQEQLMNHPLKGSIFENWVVAESYKKFHNRGEVPSLYFWRDQSGHEIDLVREESTYLNPVEIKLSSTFTSNFLKTLNWFNKLQSRDKSSIVYGGEESQEIKGCSLIPWKKVSEVFKSH